MGSFVSIVKYLQFSPVKISKKFCMVSKIFCMEKACPHKGHAFSMQIYRCSVEIVLLRALPAVCRANLSLLRAKPVAPYKHTKLLRTKIEIRGKFDASSHKSNASPWKIRCFSAQIKSFCVENSMFLSTNRKFPRAKFDASPYKSKAIESFSVENYTVNWAT